MDHETIFKNSILSCIDNRINSLVTFSRDIYLLVINTSLEPSRKLFDCPWNAMYETAIEILYHHI